MRKSSVDAQATRCLGEKTGRGNGEKSRASPDLSFGKQQFADGVQRALTHGGSDAKFLSETESNVGGTIHGVHKVPVLRKIRAARGGGAAERS